MTRTSLTLVKHPLPTPWYTKKYKGVVERRSTSPRQTVGSSVSHTLPRPAIWWASCARQVRPCELTTGPSTFTHGSERGLAPHPAPSDRHGQGACGPALGRAHRRMSPPARDELHVLSVCDRALIPLLDELRDERARRAQNGSSSSKPSTLVSCPVRARAAGAAAWAQLAPP